MKIFLKVAYQPYKWLFFIPFFVLWALFCGLICILVAFIFGPDTADFLAVLWSRLVCFFIPVRVRIKGRNNYDTDKAYVVVVNHRSMVDIPVIHGWLGLKIKWVIKKELKKIPVFGSACESIGCIYVDRFDRFSAIKSIQDAKKKMSKRASVLFFPEGTRTRDGSTAKFKKGAFYFAKETGLSVLPVTIKNTMRILPSDSLDLFPGTAEIIVHPPVDISNKDEEEFPYLIEEIRQTIINAL